MPKRLGWLVFTLLAMAAWVSEAKGQFTAGNLTIYQVGDGTGTLVNTGNLVLLREFTTAGTASGFQVAFPVGTTTTDSLIASGTATSEGMLTLGNFGQTLTATGYRAPTGTTGLAGTASATVNRTVALVNGQGTPSYTFLSDYATGNNPRSAFTTNGTDIYAVGGGGGIRYTTAGSTTSTQLSTTTVNLRTVQVAGGQLYVSANSGSTRVATVGTGTPTTAGQTITTLTGTPATGSPYQFFLARVGNPTFAGANVLYVADDGAATGSILKYTFDGTAWTAAGSVTAAGVRGLTGIVTADNTIQLYGTTGGSAAAGGGAIYSFSDAAAQAGTISGTAASIATAGTNTAFRGIAFSAARMEWAGGSGTWDLTTTNWTNTAPTTPVPNQAFFNAYAANFGNIAADATVTVGNGINPAAVNITNAANAYTFANATGSNGIQGLATLTKSGAGTAVLAGSNTYSGNTNVTGGTLVLGATGSINSTPTINVGTGATFNVSAVTGGYFLGATRPQTLMGQGTVTGGVTVATGSTVRAGDANGIGTLTLTNGVTAASGANLGIRITTAGSAGTPGSGGSSGGTPTAPANNNFLLVSAGGITADPTTLNYLVDGTGATFVEGQQYSYRIAQFVGVAELAGVVITDPNRFTFTNFNQSPNLSTVSLTGDTNGVLYLNFTPVPEPGTVLAIGAAVLGVGGFVRRKLRSRQLVTEPAATAA
jgi:autotransporter-associated beta strand protein